MRCAWQAFLNLLPNWMRLEVDEKGSVDGQELRIRLRQAPELIRKSGISILSRASGQEDISYIINSASRYSPWTASTISKGYITASGGHRIGMCGQAYLKDGCPAGIRDPSSLCIRIARDFPGIAMGGATEDSVLIIGSPGSGKTTLLRDLIRMRAKLGRGSVSVIDERGELFPYWNGESCYRLESGIDVMTGIDKPHGVEMVLRTMGPVCIAVDEITAASDTETLLQAAWCGVNLLATAHASCRDDLERRPIYRSLIENGIFQHLIVMRQDKSWKMERMVK